jgi:hypothetical protein
MVTNIRVIGQKIFNIIKENNTIKMEEPSKEILLMVINLDKVSISLMTEELIKETIIMGCVMVLVSINWPIAKNGIKDSGN